MKNKFTSALLALAIAFGMWVYVITTVSPGSEETFHNIPVVREGESVLQERGLMITQVSSTNVSLTLSGTRKDLAKVNSGNITLKVDISKIYEPGTHVLRYTPSYPGDVASNAFVVESRQPESITFVVEERRSKEIPVEIVWVGSAPEGFVTEKEDSVLDYPMVMVAGPASVADQIEKAVIEVDLNDRRESISESYRYTLCDKEGNPVDAALITTNVQEVRLDVKIQRFKEVALTYQLVEGGGATEKNTRITMSVKSILVSGSDAALENLGDNLVVGTINLANISGTGADLIMPIHLPEGITNLSGIAETKISVSLTGLKTEKFAIEDFEIINVPAGMEVELTTKKLDIMVRGPINVMQKLTAADIRVIVDFNGAEAKSDYFPVTITFASGYNTVGLMDTYSVFATVRAVAD